MLATTVLTTSSPRAYEYAFIQLKPSTLEPLNCHGGAQAISSGFLPLLLNFEGEHLLLGRNSHSHNSSTVVVVVVVKGNPAHVHRKEGLFRICYFFVTVYGSFTKFTTLHSEKSEHVQTSNPEFRNSIFGIQIGSANRNALRRPRCLAAFHILYVIVMCGQSWRVAKQYGIAWNTGNTRCPRMPGRSKRLERERGRGVAMAKVLAPYGCIFDMLRGGGTYCLQLQLQH